MSAGSDALDPRNYVENGRILVGKLGRRGIGAIVAAFFSGTVGLILSIAELPLGLLSGLSSWYGRYIETWGVVLGQLSKGSIAAASESVASFGILGFAVAAAIVVGSLGISGWVISRVV